MSTSLHTWSAAKTRLADGELLQVAVNRKEFLKDLEYQYYPNRRATF